MMLENWDVLRIMVVKINFNKKSQARSWIAEAIVILLVAGAIGAIIYILIFYNRALVDRIFG